MTTEMQNVYAQFIEKSTALKNLTSEVDALKKEIIKYHDGKELICEDGYQSKLTMCTKNTPIVEEIERKFNIVLGPECFKTTTFPRIMGVKKLVLS